MSNLVNRNIIIGTLEQLRLIRRHVSTNNSKDCVDMLKVSRALVSTLTILMSLNLNSALTRSREMHQQRNGTGPKTCDDLQSLGHFLDGFYMIRFDSNRVDIIYCNLSNAMTNQTNNPNIIKHTTKFSPPVGSYAILRWRRDSALRFLLL